MNIEAKCPNCDAAHTVENAEALMLRAAIAAVKQWEGAIADAQRDLAHAVAQLELARSELKTIEAFINARPTP